MLIAKIKEHSEDTSLYQISKIVRVNHKVIYNIVKWKQVKLRKQTIDRLYDYYRIPKDTFYYQNMKKRYNPTFSVIGNIFRLKRLQMWYSLDEVAWLLKWDKRQLQRIEQWKSLPSKRAYYISQMLILYKFSEQQKETIRRGIKSLKDLLKLVADLDDDGKTTKKLWY